MKKLLIIITLIILMSGCEKERCYECVATCTIDGYSATSTSVYCGDMTKKEVEDLTMSTSVDGMYCTVTCKEQ